MIDARVVQLSGRNPIVEVPVPAGWAPNVHVGVLVLRGRLREAPWWSFFTWGWREPSSWWQAFRFEGRDHRAPTALVDLAKPTFKYGVATLEVGRAAQTLDVTVTADRPSDQAYAVRETVKALVRVTHAGKPLAGAEVAFAAVDEGLLALMPNRSWDLLDALYAPRPWGVETSTAQGELIGRRHYGRKALPSGGGGGRNPTRELFDTVLLWRGTVVLDAKGEARIDVPLNDSLTRFRLVAIADDGGAAGGGRFGTGSTQVRVSQDLQMLSGLAPLVREGDRIDAAFTLRNTTDRAMTVRVALAGQSDAAVPTVPVPPAQTLQLAAGAAQDLRWGVAVPDGATRIEWTAEASETGSTPKPASDRPEDRSGSAAPGAAARVAGQPDAAGQRGRRCALEVGGGTACRRPARPQPAAGHAEAQPRGHRRRHGQRRRPARRAPLVRGPTPTPAWNSRPRAPSACATRPPGRRWGGEVTGYLDSDGLAGYFPPQPGDAPRGSDRLTAYLLSAAHEAGWAWPDTARESMLAGLTAFVEGRVVRRFNAPRADLEARKLSALEALSRHGPRRAAHAGFGVVHAGGDGQLAHERAARRLAGFPARRSGTRAHGASRRHSASVAYPAHRRRHHLVLQHRSPGRLVVADGRRRRQRRTPAAGSHRDTRVAERSAAPADRSARPPAARRLAHDHGQCLGQPGGRTLQPALRGHRAQWPHHADAGRHHGDAGLGGDAGRQHATAAAGGRRAGRPAQRRRPALADGADAGRGAPDRTPGRRLPHHAHGDGRSNASRPMPGAAATCCGCGCRSTPLPTWPGWW